MPRDHRDQIVRRRQSPGTPGKGSPRKLLNEIIALLIFGLGVVFLLALISYNSHDPSWNASGPHLTTQNWIGPVGALLADTLYQALGYAAILVPFALFAIAWWRLINPRPAFSGVRLIGLLLLGVALMGLLSLAEACSPQNGRFHSGGFIGHVMICDPNYGFNRFLNMGGSAVVLTIVFLGGLILATPFSLLGLVMRLTPRERETGVFRVLTERFRLWRQAKAAAREREREATRLQDLHEKPADTPSSAFSKPLITIRDQSIDTDEETRVIRRGERSPTREAAKQETELSANSPVPSATPVAPVSTVQKTPEVSTASVTPAVLKSAVRLPSNGKNETQDHGEGGNGQSNASETVGTTPSEAARTPGLPTIDRIGSRFPRFRLRGRTASEPAEETAAPDEPTTEDDDLNTSAPDRPEMHLRGTTDKAKTRSSSFEQPHGARTLDEMLAGATVRRAQDSETDSGSPSKLMARPRIRPLVEFRVPSTEMLTQADPRSELADSDLRDRAQQLAEKCREFNVAGVVKQISPGPVVTTFEFMLDPGVKYGRVTSLVDDLCLGLKAESIRIDRIPGKSTVGIEVPNHKREVIRLREVIESKKFRESPSKLTLALGKTIDGTNYVADLARMPHLLIAGATGAGKSVALNAVLLSMIFKATPDEVKFLLIDPKRLELGLYSDIPHLLTPIVTDPKRASYALKWAVAEMENRYRHLAAFGVRNIDQYNQIVGTMVDRSLADESIDLPRPLPYLVIIIDELADLMMVSARDVEESITRLAQMARAVGIHLVLATQRPSTDVITGLIKANFPSRISFRVSSKVDSRVIIDTNGAEGLLGQGDMLFLPPGTSRLIRVHGAFVDEQEIKRIADFVRGQGAPQYDERVQLSERELEGEAMDELRRDEKYEEAMRIVVEMGRASTSVLQRRLRIGYGRAASIIDMMHREGLVGPEDGSKPRQVLIAPEDRGPFLERLSQIREEQEV